MLEFRYCRCLIMIDGTVAVKFTEKKKTVINSDRLSVILSDVKKK